MLLTFPPAVPKNIRTRLRRHLALARKATSTADVIRVDRLSFKAASEATFHVPREQWNAIYDAAENVKRVAMAARDQAAIDRRERRKAEIRELTIRANAEKRALREAGVLS